MQSKLADEIEECSRQEKSDVQDQKMMRIVIKGPHNVSVENTVLLLKFSHMVQYNIWIMNKTMTIINYL